MVARLFWLGESGPDLFPGFFQVDLAPYILNFLRSDESKHLRVYGSLRSADCILCTALLLFASALPLLQSRETASYVDQHAKHQIAEYGTASVFLFRNKLPTHWMFVFVFSMVAFQLCQWLLLLERFECGLEGKLPQHHIDCGSNG